MGLGSREAAAAAAAEWAPVEEGRFGPGAAAGGGFGVARRSAALLPERAGLGGAGLAALALLRRGLGAAFSLGAPTAGCGRRTQVNNEQQNQEGKQRNPRTKLQLRSPRGPIILSFKLTEVGLQR